MKMRTQTSDRAQREAEQYNRGIPRSIYTQIFGINYYDKKNRDNLFRDALQHANGKTALEIGSNSWIDYIERNQIRPQRLECINISQQELLKGIEKAKQSITKPNFSLMDAHELEFDNESFDVIFGKAILHHLNLKIALHEIQRVLKPGGQIIFSEPLGVNPIANLIRLLTPHARTTEEHPFGPKDLKLISYNFRTTFHYSQFLSVPASILSNILCLDPTNCIINWSSLMDKRISRSIPFARLFFRSVTIIGTKYQIPFVNPIEESEYL